MESIYVIKVIKTKKGVIKTKTYIVRSRIANVIERNGFRIKASVKLT
jgi:hypothetical protein